MRTARALGRRRVYDEPPELMPRGLVLGSGGRLAADAEQLSAVTAH